MKAVILAAGKSTRTYPLTITTPKPLLKVLGKELISYTIEGNMDLVSQWYIVVGHGADLVKEYLSLRFPTLLIHYIDQSQVEGTGAALELLRSEFDNESFLVFNGDDIYFPGDIKTVIEHPAKYAILSAEVEDPSRFGVLQVEGDNLLSLVEKPQEFISNKVNIGVYKLHSDIFSYTLSRSERGEYEIVEYITLLLKDGQDVSVCPVEGFWLPISFPWDILSAQRALLERGDVRNIIPTDAQVHTTAYMGQNVVLGAGCIIGENVELENVCVGDRVVIGDNVRLSGSVLGDDVEVKSDVVADGSECEVCRLPIGGKEIKDVTPSYKGIFVEPGSIVEGFYLEPTFITK